MMNENQLARLRVIEEELLALQRQATALAVRAYELHEATVEMLTLELARPLATTGDIG